MKQGKHLLVIRLSAMGDVAITVPVLLALSQQHPHVQITLLTRAFFAPMFADIANVNIHVADVKGKHKGILGLWKLYRELKSLHIDAIGDFHNVLRSNILRFFFRFNRIPFIQIDKGRVEKKALIKGNSEGFKPLKSTHERYAEVLFQLQFPVEIDKVALLPKLQIPKEIETLGTRKKIGIAPFAAFEGKMYPLHLMEEVVSYLNSEGSYDILLFGGGDEEMRKLNSWEAAYPAVINASAKLSFAQELELISNLDLMIAMDSGNGHLAAMYGVPVITIWGVTHPYAGFSPYGQNPDNAILADRKKFPLIPTSIYGNKVPEGYEKVMETISPQQIIDRVRRQLHQ